MKRESLGGPLFTGDTTLVWYENRPGESFEPSFDVTDLVTVVLPVKNAETTIRRCIDSVLSQQDCKIELVVVDDGSTDSTKDLLFQYGNSIKLLTQPPGGVNGLGATRNRAALSGYGKWIAFIDADDVWHPQKIRSQLQAAAATDASFIFSNARVIGSDRVRERAYDVDLRPKGDVLRRLIQDNFIFTSSVMVSRQLFLGLGGFTTEPDVVQDWDLWLRIAGNGNKFVGHTQVLIDYHWTPGSVSKSHDSMRRRRMGALKKALNTTSVVPLSIFEKRIALSNLEAVSAWFAAKDNRSVSFLWYIRSLMYWPFNKEASKGLLRTMLGLH